TGAGDDVGIGAVAGLAEGEVGVVGDVALQAGGGARQDAGADGGAAGVGVGAAEGRKGTRLNGRHVGGGDDVICVKKDARSTHGQVLRRAADIARRGER